MKKWLTIIHDIDGLSRAWGLAATGEAAREEAERQWKVRVEQRERDGTTDRSEERGATTSQRIDTEAV